LGPLLADSTVGDPQSTVFYCTFTDNSASGGEGGGLYYAAEMITLEANILVGNSASMGGDIFRAVSTITSGGYNVIRDFGVNTGAGDSGGVDWKKESGVAGLRVMDKFSDAYTKAVLFGSNVLDANDSEKSPYKAGYLSSQFWSPIKTLKLQPADASTTLLNPALGILPGTTGRANYVKFFNNTYNSQHVDARGVLRGTTSTTTQPAGGPNCDAGAYQSIDSSWSGPGPGGSNISHVQIGGLPNFTLRVGQTCALGASVFVYNTDGGGPELSRTEPVTWSSGNTRVARIDNYGNLVLIDIGESLITLSSVNNSRDGKPAEDTKLIKVELYAGPNDTNIAYDVWNEMATFNAGLSDKGVQVYLDAKSYADIVGSLSFGDLYRQIYNAEPKQIAAITTANGLSFRQRQNYRGATGALKPSVGFSMSTLANEGALLAMKYVYNIEWKDVERILGKAVTEPTEGDIKALFSSLSLVFTNEQGENVIVIDRDGSEGVAVADALSSGALKVGGVNTTPYDSLNSINSLVMQLSVLIGDASAAGGKSVNLINDTIIVADNNANERIDGEMWLLGETSGGEGGGGGGGGCDAGFGIPAFLTALTLCLAVKRGQ
jgi:hypothetical protein